MALNPDEFRGKENERRLRNRNKDIEAARRHFREWYARNGDKARYAIYEARNKADPVRALPLALREFRSGKIGVDELNRRYDQFLKRADEIVSKKSKAKRR
jgi:ATP-dependent exoDNAse (exonuclease V) alpha subunit